MCQQHLTIGISDQGNLEGCFLKTFKPQKKITTAPLEEKEQCHLDKIEFRIQNSEFRNSKKLKRHLHDKVCSIWYLSPKRVLETRISHVLHTHLCPFGQQGCEGWHTYNSWTMPRWTWELFIDSQSYLGLCLIWLSEKTVATSAHHCFSFCLHDFLSLSMDSNKITLPMWDMNTPVPTCPQSRQLSSHCIFTSNNLVTANY